MIFPPLRAGETTGRSEREGARGTLGDLLYADRTRTPVSEEEWVALVRSIAAGDQGALRALYDRTHRIVYTLIMRIVDNPQAAEELTLDVFHDVWRRRARTYEAAGGTVVGWIMNQARSRAIDRLRFEQRKKRAGQGPDMSGAAPDPQDAFDAREQGRLLRDALTALTPNERQAIEIAYFSGFTYAEVAERLQQPLGTVKTRIRSGLEKLRRALAGESR